jgi:hypothetical protein
VESFKNNFFFPPYIKLKRCSHLVFGISSEVLLGQTIECCALFGEASGKDVFAADAVAMMHSLAQTDPESGSMPYVMKAWVRIARCLGADFAPFLPYVITKLLMSLSQSIGTPVDDPDDVEDEPDIQLIETDDGGWVAIRTSAVEEQSSALRVNDDTKPAYMS